jgi:23S rRNA (cytosine1962-C5)-methyltransferase
VGIHAALPGAEQVTAIDESRPALEFARHNGQLNGVDDSFETLEGDAFRLLQDLHTGAQRFDVVILDPPAFIKRKRDIKQGTLAYRRLNEFAVRVLGRDALLVSCSCSYHLSLAQLVAQIHQAARHLDRDLQILSLGGQAPNHPLNPAIAETACLKAVFARLTR